jgi:sugar O-acyltransferase (sialic acid O-acetyltransferase NeuD family)
MTKNYIYGAGGHGKVVLDAMHSSDIECSGFVDDKSIVSWFGLKVSKISDLDSDNSVFFHLAIGDCNTRALIASRLLNKNFITVIHRAAVLSEAAIVGVGCFLAAQSVIGPCAKIGNHCIVNHSAVIDHDCCVGDFCHVAPNSVLCGGVKVGNGVLLGASATVLPGITIGDFAIIGAGAVVTKNVTSGAILIGNPARPITLS